MEGFFIYLIKSCGVLALFWCCFKLFLQGETFFTLHRAFLISGIFIALLFPLWTLTQLVTVEALPYILMETNTTGPTPIVDPAFDWWYMAGVIYLVGVFFFLGRFVLQLMSLKRLIKKGVIVKNDSLVYVETREDTSPFSFFHIIVYNPTLHSPAELETILAHEKVHSLQRHSLDILLIHLFSAFQWINPFVWWYKITLTQNLEYIADQGVAKNMGNCREYQYLLLKNVSASVPHSSIINPIFNSSIKKRIVMLNKNRSHQFKAWKFSLVIPFLAFFLVAFNTHTVTQVNPGNIGSTPNQDNGDNNITKIRYTIDKTTTDEALKNISATLKKDYKVDLLFKDISRNAKGHITAIHSTFTMDGGSGTSSSSDTEGIKPFLFNLETDKEGKLISVGFEMLGHEDPTIPKLNGVQASDASKILEVRSSPFGDPLYIVDGVEYDLGSEPLGIDPKNVQSIDVIKKTEAIKQYGEKGKNGVINVITIKKSDSKGPNDVIHVLTSTDNGTDPNTQDKIPSTITITGYKASDLDPKPLIIVDGIEKAVSFNVNTISADNFENIRVLKDGEATQQFGEKGENGVIEITTKKTGWTVGYGVNMDDPNDLFDIGPFRQNGLEKAVIFVDGANKGRNYVPTMKYSEVESIGSYGPGKSTTDKFGRQGRNGVIEIITKKN